MKKLVVVENIRRAWLSNIINFYPLLFVLPFYLLVPIKNILNVLLYSYVAVLAGSYVVFRIALKLQKNFVDDLERGLGDKMSLDLVFYTIYGDCEPRVMRFFVPFMIFMTALVGYIVTNFVLQVMLIFTLIFIIIFSVTYRNVYTIRRNLERFFALLDEQQ